MELSYYAWLWIAMGAVFVPVEVVAYIVSIVKVVIDRTRIRKTNTSKRQTKLNGIPSVKKSNIQIIHDEERAIKFRQNGTRQIEHTASSTKPSSSPTNSIGRNGISNHNQNGGHSVKVAVEHTVVVHNLQHSRLEQDMPDSSVSRNITRRAHRSTSIAGDDLGYDTSICEANSDMAIEINSEPLHISERTAKNSTTVRPHCDYNKQQKQRPTKPKRSQHRSNYHKESSLNNSENCHDSNVKSNTFTHGGRDMVSSASINDKLNFRSCNSEYKRRYSSVGTTNIDTGVVCRSPNRSLSEDNLCDSERLTHLNDSKKNCGNDTASMFSHYINTGFVESFEELKTNL